MAQNDTMYDDYKHTCHHEGGEEHGKSKKNMFT